MEFQFVIQDPTNPHTIYYYETLLQCLASRNTHIWRGIFAFATGDAVRSTFVNDPDVQRFLERGEVDLLIGIDAVTNVSALEELQSLTIQRPSFRARVFVNPGTGLFHPKVSYFIGGGESTLLVGSANFTKGGLRRNVEAYSIASGTEEEISALPVWQDFFTRHNPNIRVIDENVLDFARVNQERRIGARRPRTRDHGPIAEEVEETGQDIIVSGESRVLIAVVPRAGERWQQIHYNQDIIQQFFRLPVATKSGLRVFLQEVRPDRTTSAPEIRHLVYSSRNQNLKIEIGARRGRPYPDVGFPLIVLNEVGTRSFRYTLLMPHDDGYSAISSLLASLPRIGRGVHRSITTLSRVRSAWNNCPL
jgi:hypothetical protein